MGKKFHTKKKKSKTQPKTSKWKITTSVRTQSESTQKPVVYGRYGEKSRDNKGRAVVRTDKSTAEMIENIKRLDAEAVEAGYEDDRFVDLMDAIGEDAVFAVAGEEEQTLDEELVDIEDLHGRAYHEVPEILNNFIKASYDKDVIMIMCGNSPDMVKIAMAEIKKLFPNQDNYFEMEKLETDEISRIAQCDYKPDSGKKVVQNCFTFSPFRNDGNIYNKYKYQYGVITIHSPHRLYNPDSGYSPPRGDRKSQIP